MLKGLGNKSPLTMRALLQTGFKCCSGPASSGVDSIIRTQLSKESSYSADLLVRVKANEVMISIKDITSYYLPSESA